MQTLILISTLLLGVLPSDATRGRVEYVAAGGTQFTFGFKTLATSHVKVYKNGALQSTGYSVSLYANQDSSPGGTVTFTTAPTNGTRVKIERTLPVSNESPWTSFSRASALGLDLDRRAMIEQQLERRIVDHETTADSIAAVANGDTPVTAIGGSTALALKDHFASVVNVKSHGAKGDNTTDDAAAIAAAGQAGARVYFPPLTYRVGSNLVIPEGVTLVLPRGASLAVASGVSITVDGLIEAGHYPIFSFADPTAVVTASDPGQWNTAAGRVRQRDVKVDWFGAVPDAVAPLDRIAAPNGVPTGTDSSDAFRRAMRFAQLASLKDGSGTFIYTPYVTLSFAPNGVYRVRGDNLLGIQATGGGAARIIYEGNGAQILHEVLAAGDTLIKNAAYLYRPIFRDFSVDPFNANSASRQGDFLTTNSPGGTVQFVHPQFTNIRIAMPYTNRGYDRIFFLDGSTMCDNGIVRNSQFGSFNKLWYNTNGEAVNWLFDKNTISPTTDGSVMFDVAANFSGTLNVTHNEMVLSGATPLILRTTSASGAAPYGKFSFRDNRIEERQESDTSHFDVSYGIVEFDGTNMLAGATAGGGARTPNKRIAIIRGNAQVRLRNCMFQTNQVTIQTNVLGSTGRRSGLYVDNCGFQNESKTGNAAGPGIKYLFLDPAGASTSMKSALASSGWKSAEVVDMSPGATGRVSMPHILNAGNARQQTVTTNTIRASDGKSTANVFFELPSWVVITSVKLYAKAWNVAEIDRITLHMSNAAGGVLDPNTTVLAGTAVSGQELLQTGKHITITDYNYALMGAYWGIGGTPVTDVDKMPESYLEVTYEGISRPAQAPDPVTASYYEHDPL